MTAIPHATSSKAARNNHFPSLTSSQNQISNLKNQKSFPSRPLRPLREPSPAPHAKSAKVTTNIYLTKNNPFRPLRPLREPSHAPHAKSATFAKDFSDLKNNPFRFLRPLREPSPTPHAKSAKRGRFSALSFLKFRIPHFALPNQISPFRPFRPWREPSAFSLTEVVIAMGVAAVAFTSIIALFPLGLNMSKESYEETQAALLAQTILTDLKDQQVGNRNKRYSVAAGSPYSYKLIQIAGNVDPQIVTTNYLGIDLRLLTQQNVYLAYDSKTRTDTDPTSQPIMLRPSAGILNTIPPWYSGTTISNGLAAVAKVTFVPTFTITTLTSTTGVIRVDISIETPGSAKPENRTVRMYTGAICP